MLWLLCVASAFVVTHLPPPKVTAPPLVNDKVLHFVGFAALGIVGIWRLNGTSRPIRLAEAAVVLAGLAVYAAVDELTQPYFGRSCEFGDWVADVCGAFIGVLIGLACHRRTQATVEN